MKEKKSGEEKQASRIKLFLSRKDKDKDKEKEKGEKSGGGAEAAEARQEPAQAEGGRSSSKEEQKRKRRSISLPWKWRTARNAGSDEPAVDDPADTPPLTANESFGAEQHSAGRSVDPVPETEHLVLRGESPTDAKDNVDRHRSYRVAKERGEVPRGTTPTADQQQSLPLLDEPLPGLDKLDKGASSSKRAMTSQQAAAPTTFLGGVGGGTISSPLGVLTSALSTKDYVTDKSTGRRYIRGKLLGKGGFAKCFEFIDEKSHVKYAGKIIAKARFLKTHQKEKYMQIMREIDLHRSLQHPNVVGFYNYFEDNDNMNIVLELCSRRTLVEMVRTRKILTEPEVRYFMKQMVEGCRYIHGRQIIHRDFKLGNMLLSDSMELKIADFGLATQVMYEGEKKFTVCGTPNYIAPEVLGKRGHSFEVDIWAMGCILYALLVGCPPFETTSLKETYARIMANRYYIPAHVALPARSLIRKLLNGEPYKRPNFDQILNDEFFKSGFMPHSLPPQCCEQVPKFTARQQNNNLLEIPSSSTSLLDTVPAQEDKKSRHREREKKSADNVLVKSEKRRSGADSDKAALLDKQMDKIELGSAELLDLKTSPVKKRLSKEIKEKEKPVPKAEVESSSSEESESDSDDSEEETDSASEEDEEWGARRIPASVQKQEAAKLAQRRASSGFEGKTVSRSGSDKSQQQQLAINKSDDILDDRPKEKLTSSKPGAAEPFSRPKSKSLEMKRAKEVQHRVQNLQMQLNNEKMWQLAQKESRKDTVGSTPLREAEKPVTDERFNTDVLTKLSTIALTVQAEGRPEGRLTPLGRVTPQTASAAAVAAQDKQLIPEHLAEKSNTRGSSKDAVTSAAPLKQSKTADNVTQLVGSKSRNSLSESADDVTPPPDLKASKRFLSERGKSGEKRDVRKEIEMRRQQTAKSSGPAPVGTETGIDDAKSMEQDHLLNYDKSLKRNASKEGRRKKSVDDQAKKMADDGGKKAEDEAAAAGFTPGRRLSRQKPLEKGLFNPFAPREIVTNADDESLPASAFSPVKSSRDEVKVKDEMKVGEEVKSSKDEGKPRERLSRSPPQAQQQQGDDIPRIKLTTIDRSPLRRQGSGGKQKDDTGKRQPPVESVSPPVAMDTSITSAVSQDKPTSRPTSYHNATPIDMEASSRSVMQPSAAGAVSKTTSTTSGVGVGKKTSLGRPAAFIGQGQGQGQRSLAAPPPPADRDVSKSPSDMLFSSSQYSGLNRPGSYALPLGPEDELHKITSSLAQLQATRKPTQVVTPLPGEPVMEEDEEGGAMWGEGEDEDMAPVTDDLPASSDLPGHEAAFGSSEPSEVIPGTALALYQMLKLFSSDIPSRNNPPPIHDISPLYVAKWVDYSNKYGFGFQLSDNSVGVLFNDKTRMIFTAHGSQRMIHYSDATSQVTSFPWDAVPALYHKKSTLLFHYAQYMDKHLIPGAASSSSSLSRSTTSPSPVFLKKWFRANKAIVLYLSNGTLQVNFLHDHTKVIISSVSTEYCVTFINNKRIAVTYNLRNLATFGCRREMSERLVYARRMMENVMNFEGVAV